MASSDMLDLGFRPHKWQMQMFHQMKRFSILVCHRRFGKTVMAIMALINAALHLKRVEPHGRFLFAAPVRRQAKEIAWGYLKSFGMKIPGTKANEADLSLIFPHNGARITIVGMRNIDAHRGIYLDGAVLDEFAQMPPTAWEEIVRPALADYKGWALFTGTPKGVNHFYDLWHKAKAQPELWCALLFTILDTELPWLDDEELEVIKATTRSDAVYRQEYLCDWSASSEDTLIPIDLILASAKKRIEPHQFSQMPKVLGVDVAFSDRSTADRSVIIKRQGLAMFPPKIYKGVDNIAILFTTQLQAIGEDAFGADRYDAVKSASRIEEAAGINEVIML